MSRNPILPYAVIAIVGLFLIIIISYVGVNHREAAESENNNNNAEEAMDVEAVYKNQCATCHGDDLSGDAGPSLLNLGNSMSSEEIQDVINNGADGMPGGLVDPQQAEEIAEWLLEQED